MKNVFNMNVTIALLFLIPIIAVCFPFLSNQVLAVNGDGLGYMTGKLFMMDSLKAGELPLWNPYAGLGTPFLADIQNTVFSPFNILYFLFDTPLAFNLMRVLQMFLASFFMYLLIENMTKDRIVAVVAGAVFGFSTMMGGMRTEHHTFASTIALFPAVLYCLERYKTSKNEKWLAFSSVALAVQFLSGFTQICFYFNIFAFVYFIYVLYETNDTLKAGIWKIIKWGSSYVALISVQLFPLLQLMHQSRDGKVSWFYFSSFSYDLRILLMMLFPYGYVEFNSPGSVYDMYYSSEMNIEIYIGIICLVYIIFEIFYHYKDRRTKIFTNVAIVAFCYGMVAHIPIVKDIVYRIPILNGFRCSARIISLFLFCLLVLFGFGLSRIRAKDELKNIMKISNGFIILLGSNLLIMLFVFSQEILFTTEMNQGYRIKFLSCLSMALIIVLLNHMFLKLFCRFGKWETLRKVMILMLGIIIVCDVLRFSRVADERINDVQNVLPSHLPAVVEETVNSDTENNFRSFLALKKLEELPWQYTRLGQSGRALNEEKFLYNSYITFLDEKLEFWGIKETLIYPQFIRAVKNQNDLVSMMGIRHVVDSKTSDIEWSGTDGTVERYLCELSEIVLPGTDEISVFRTDATWLEEDSYYEIIVESEFENPPSFFNVDLYGQDYDSAEQESALYRTANDHEYRAIISTDSIPSGIPIYIRIMGNNKEDITINRLIINKVKKETILQELPTQDEAVRIYENPNARPLLYIPENIYSIESYGENSVVSGMQDVDRNNYIVDYGKNLELSVDNSELYDIDMQRNSIRANVVADNDTFVNFSQLSYPGWKAYVDGEQVECYTVNNLIMGAEVPAGTHSIEFRFTSNYATVGLMITVIGALATLMWVFGFKPWRRKK